MVISDKSKWDKVRKMYHDEHLDLGPYFSEQLESGHALFTLSRYKFVTRLMAGKKSETLELGCSEGIGTLQLARVSESVTAVDFEKKWIKWAKKNLSGRNIDFIHDDFLGKTYGQYDTVVSIDVLEHISADKEKQFVSTLYDNLKDTGFCVVGTPNISASQYASEKSKIGHINLYSANRLEELLNTRFNNVFMFGMNDEVVHTGYRPMTHYLMALACNKK